MSRNVADKGHGEEMRKSDREPEVKSVGDEERAQEAADGAFPSFFGGDFRRERMFAEGTADEVGDRVRSPSDREGEEEKARAVANGVKAHCKGKRKGNEEKRARGDASRGEAFDKGTAGEER